MSGAPADREQAAAGAPTGMRRQVTVLFADMAGYTALAERLGEENTYHVMQRVHRALNEAVHAHNGTVQEMTGDGVMALFGAPIAVEDAPLRACRAALDIQARMVALAGEVEAEHGARPGFRVGIHSGPLVVGEVGDAHKSGITALGDTVNLAARIESQAGSGEVMLSDATHALVEGYVESAFVGERAIKGKAEPQKLWRLDAIRQGVTRFDISRGRGLTPLVGRRREIESLEALWREASAGAMRTVTIIGEPGIGKSRLVHELRQRIDDGRTFFLAGQCTSNQQAAPFAPLTELIRQAFGIADGADAAAARSKLTLGLEMLGLAPDNTLPYLMDLFGYPPDDDSLDEIAGETLAIRTRDAVLAVLRERCRISPTAAFVEDLHWVDTATEALLARAVADCAGLPLLLVTTARPGYTPPWAGTAGTSELRPAPLSESAMAELLKARLGATAALPEALARIVAEKSQGNPFFAEEITGYLRTTGAIRALGDSIVFERDQASAALPATVENLLMDRFDRLDRGQRAVLEAAAVVGFRFSAPLVGAAAGLDGEADLRLAQLGELGLIVGEPGGGWRFGHALVRDAIYNSMLTPRRQTLHGRVAEAVEARHAGYPEEAADVLAHHWSRTARADKAVKYLALAGESALRIYSLEEAERHFSEALDLIEDNPDSADDALLTDVLLDITRVMYFQWKFAAIIELVERYLPRVEALGDKKRLARFLFEAGYAHVFASNVVEGRRLLAQSRALGEEIGDELTIAYADMGTMWDRMFWGEPGPARFAAQREAGERVAAVGLRHRDIWLASKGQLALGLDFVAWGRPGEAKTELMKLMPMSRETNDPRPRAMGLWGLAALGFFTADYAAAIENADEAIRISLNPIDHDSALGYKSMSLILSGQAAAGMAIAAPLIEDIEAKGYHMSLMLAKMVRGAGVLQLGDMAGGVRGIENAVSEADGWGQTGARAFGDLFLGETYLQIAIGDDKPPLAVMLRNLGFLVRTVPFAKAKARRYLQRAVDHFRAMDLPAFLARALYDLGQLDAATRRAAAARDKFAEARQIAQTVEATDLVSQIDAASAKLPTS